ncbi:hypothetical protein [Pararhizobium sp. PWRC1-1]|uniref:hypothetical protein n=1 Tax=Pararhizobium sp. PWRC1-1 TaxID=2804566 RepID=UPI003CFAEC8B
MKKVLTLALAAAISATTLSGVAYAQTATTTTMTDDMVTIIVVDQKSDDASKTQQIPESVRAATPEAMIKAQTEIQTDAALMAILQQKNVQLENVIGIQTAANGGKVVYVK